MKEQDQVINSFDMSQLLSFNESFEFSNEYLQQLNSQMTLQNPEENPKIPIILLQIKRDIKELLLKGSFQQIIRNFKKIVQRLVCLKKNVILRKKTGVFPANDLDQIMMMASILLQSTQYKKYGHIFPEVGYLIKKYEFPDSRKNLMTLQSQVNRIKMNEQSQIYRKISENSISANELKLLSQGTVEDVLLELSQNQILLQNPQCLCCSQVFIKNFPIHNTNPMIPIFRQISTKIQINKENIRRYLIGLCNKGGGVLIIGAEKKFGITRSTGIRFSDQNQILEYQNQIKQSLQSIRPRFNYLLERVLVHTNFLQQVSIENSAQEYMRICFRILILPEYSHKLTYAEVIQKGKANLYEFYDFSESEESQLVKVNSVSISMKKEENDFLYDLIQRKYKKRKTFQNSHKNINCLRPHKQYSKIFTKYAQSPQLKIELKQNQSTKNQISDDCSTFKYTNASLLVVSCKQNDRYKENLCDSLKNRKKAFSVWRPFQASFKQNVRSIWVMTHEISTAQLKKIYKNLQTREQLPPQIIKIMPIHKVLQVSLEKFNEYNKKIFTKRFTQKFSQMFTIQTCKIQDDKQVMHLYFNDFNQSIYAYLIFEEMQIFAYFIKEGGAYLKK